jgi:hypothetical protein
LSGFLKTMVDLNFAKFVAKWFAEYPVPLPAGALLNLAEECGVRLAGATKRARRISLGCLLSSQIGEVVEVEGVRLTVRRGPFISGRQYYEARKLPLAAIFEGRTEALPGRP